LPTETFFHLPAEKQKRIMNAAKKEFSRLPLKDASIATIIKDAEIPRGSFYQYFENKEDLYYYYFHTLKSDSQRDLIRSIQHEKGDLFAGFEWYFSRMIEEVLKGKNANFYRNLFLSMDYRSFHKVMPEIHKKMHHAHHEERKATRKKEEAEFFAEIDKDLLKVADDHELKLLIQLLMQSWKRLIPAHLETVKSLFTMSRMQYESEPANTAAKLCRKNGKILTEYGMNINYR